MKDYRHTLIESFSKDETEKYEASIGRLTVAWASVEHELYLVISKYSGVTERVARALFANQRAKYFRESLIKIVDNTEVAKKQADHLKLILKKVEKINELRDLLTHQSTDHFYFTKEDPPKRVVIKTQPNKTKQSGVHIVDSAMIDDICYDLQIVSRHLLPHWYQVDGVFKLSDAPLDWKVVK